MLRITGGTITGGLATGTISTGNGGNIAVEYESKGVQIVGIPSDFGFYSNGSINEELLADAKHVVSQTGVTYLNILPCEALNQNKLNLVNSVPETIFLDENGNRIGNSYMGSRSYEQWCEIIDGLLAELDK